MFYLFFQELLKNMLRRCYLLKNALFSMKGVRNELFMRNIPISKMFSKGLNAEGHLIRHVSNPMTRDPVLMDSEKVLGHPEIVLCAHSD